MGCNPHYWASVVVLLCSLIASTTGHGRFIDPPSRVSAWRYGCTDCAQAEDYIDLYTDTQWNCGGLDHQTAQGGACGTCGDPADGPYESEAGGPYATGTIVKTYTKGATIEVSAEITASHLGYIVFKLCPVNNMYVKATQECFDMYPLALADDNGVHPFRTYIPQIRKIYTVSVVLPPDLTCTQCVMQWDYWTENRWGECGNGTGALGCGYQEQFRACADISISDDGNPVTNPPGTPPSTTKAPSTTKPVTTEAPSPSTTVPPTKCEPKNKCNKKKGTCIAKSTDCVGRVINNACKTSDCQCCVPPKPCKQPNKCKKKGGSCISSSLQCNGKVLKKKCKGNKCQCCKPNPTTPTSPPASTTGSPSILGCPIFINPHTWDYNVQGDLQWTFPSKVSSWDLDLTFDTSISNFQVYIMIPDTSSGTKFTLTPYDWNSVQEAGTIMKVFIWIEFTGFQTPQLTSVKLSGQELC